jgi:hypothetical protein
MNQALYPTSFLLHLDYLKAMSPMGPQWDHRWSILPVARRATSHSPSKLSLTLRLPEGLLRCNLFSHIRRVKYPTQVRRILILYRLMLHLDHQ